MLDLPPLTAADREEAREMRQGFALLVPIVIGLAVVGLLIGNLVRHTDPGRRARLLRLTGFWVVAGIAGFFGLFVVGEMASDPGGWAAVWLIAAYTVPLAACCFLAWRRPDAGAWVLAILTAALLAVDVWVAISPGALRDFEDRTGPVQAVAIFAVAAAVAVLGLAWTRVAGTLLVLLGAGAWVSGIGGVGGGAALAIVGGPVLLGGVLYLTSAAVAGRASPVNPSPDRSGGEGVGDRADVVGEARGDQSEAR
jgi:MFS family permease